MYVLPNFKSKKALKEAVATYMRYQAYVKDPLSVEGVNWGLTYTPGTPVVAVKVFQPLGGFTGFNPGPYNGVMAVEGPHYPKPHTWYATVVVKDGIVQKVS
jgi:hypothetical protein